MSEYSDMAEMAKQYDIIMELMVRSNIAHPAMELWLADNDYMNRTVQRVIALRTSGVDPGAKAIIVEGRLLEVQNHMHFVCVVQRSNGAYEDPNGSLQGWAPTLGERA